MSSGNSSVLLKKPPLTPAGMTGVGQRMPSQQAIILRPGQQTGIVTLPGGQQVRQQVNTRPVLVNAAVSSAGGHHIRVSAPGIQTRPPLAGGRNVVINQSGSQISVPLHALQSMQAGKFFFVIFCFLLQIRQLAECCVKFSSGLKFVPSLAGIP